jgi:thymidylate synthase (FAD)
MSTEESNDSKPYLFRKKILDHGYVELIDTMGSDDAIVNAARTSYDKGTTSVSSTKILLRYLMRHKHLGPFEFCECVFRIRCPLFVARQWFRHRTGNYNEASLRYSEARDEYYLPLIEHITTQDRRNRQARTETIVGEAEQIRNSMKDDAELIFKHYQEYIDAGVAREIARNNIPLSYYTSFVFKMDLRNLLNFLTLRFDSHAQYEIRLYAIEMLEMIRHYFPLTVEAWEDYIKNGMSLSRSELNLLKMVFKENNFDIERTIADYISKYEDNREKMPLVALEKAEFIDKIKKLTGQDIELDYLGKSEEFRKELHSEE